MEVENPGLANLRSTEKRAGSEGRKAETKNEHDHIFGAANNVAKGYPCGHVHVHAYPES